MARAALATVAALTTFILAGALKAAPLTDVELIDAFRTSIGVPEFGRGSPQWQVRKYGAPARFLIQNLSSMDRHAEATAFVADLPRHIAGVEARIADTEEEANFFVFLVDRAQYRIVVSTEIYQRSIERVPGRCAVAARAHGGAIQRSVAVIVVDEGDHAFRRCLAEEILQGLGPLADWEGSVESVFNTASQAVAPTEIDLLILNILYDARLRPGMSWRRAEELLPDIIRDARRRLQPSPSP